ncbi:MAG TPA: ABC transporter permease [Fimbriimonas sp.]|nr:ABC transporter permease [Fimbriimonas sp.]
MKPADPNNKKTLFAVRRPAGKNPFAGLTPASVASQTRAAATYMTKDFGPWVRKLFFTNPMKIEVIRFKGRFINVTPSAALNRTMLAMAVLSYLAITWMVWLARRDLDPVVPILIQTVLMLLVGPAAAHGTIAGERDRKSWDLLQVAPISHAEIVTGKFLSIFAMMVAAVIAFLPSVLIAWLFHVNGYGDSTQYVTASGLWRLILIEGISLASATAATTYTIYLSSRMKSANATLATAISSLVGLYLVVPLGLAALVSNGSGKVMDLLMVYHPIWAIVRIWESANDNITLPFLDKFYGLPTIGLYALLSAVFLGAATKVLKKRAGND